MTPKQAEQHACVREDLRRRAHEINEEVHAIIWPMVDALRLAAQRMGADADRFPVVLSVGTAGGEPPRTATVEEILNAAINECLPYPSLSFHRNRVIDQWVEEQMADHIPEGDDT